MAGSTDGRGSQGGATIRVRSQLAQRMRAARGQILYLIDGIPISCMDRDGIIDHLAASGLLHCATHQQHCHRPQGGNHVILHTLHARMTRRFHFRHFMLASSMHSRQPPRERVAFGRGGATVAEGRPGPKQQPRLLGSLPSVFTPDPKRFSQYHLRPILR